MRVTILSRHAPPAHSGIGDHTDRLAGALAARGHVVTVLTSAPADERAALDVLPTIERWDARTVARATADTKPDVVLWQYNPFELPGRGLALGAGATARSLASSHPLVTYLHEVSFPWGREGMKGTAWAVSQRAQARAVRRASSAVIVTTSRRARRGDHIIPVGTNIEPAGSPARARYGIGDDALVVAHLGGVGPGKDLGPAFEALRRVRYEGIDARLLLAGDAGPFDAPADIADAITTTGRVSEAEISDALASADLYLHPDHAGASAGRRTSIVAALAHGLPLVSYRGPDRAEQLVEGQNLVVVDDGASLAAVLRRFHVDRDGARVLGEASRATFDAHFSWRVIGEAVGAVLEEVAR